jgi:CubicO group peptidase (beta-lactamase class C family)
LILLQTELFGFSHVEEKPRDQDSLFTNWSKSKSTLPTFFYKLNDFNDTNLVVEAESLINIYGIGGVVLSNGNLPDVSNWIGKMSGGNNSKALFIAEIDHVFELPFSTAGRLPSHNDVETYGDDSLVYTLGLIHADLLQRTGISILKFGIIPSYYTSPEHRKVQLYLDALLSKGMELYFDDAKANGLANSLPEISWNQIEMISQPFLFSESRKSKREYKNFKKTTNYEGLMVQSIGHNTTYEQIIEQMEMGVALLEFSDNSNYQNFINDFQVNKVNKKSFFKKAVKSFFKMKQEMQPLPIQLPFDLEELSNINSKFKGKNYCLIQDEKNLVPFIDLEKKEYFTLSSNVAIEMMVDKYHVAEHLPLGILDFSTDSLRKLFPEKSTLIIDLTLVYKILSLNDLLNKCNELDRYFDVVVLYAGTPMNLKNNVSKCTMIWSAKNTLEEVTGLVQVLFGAADVTGALPGYLNDGLTKGVSRVGLNRLSYNSISSFDLDYASLDKIDELVEEGIKEGMFPGCQIMMVKGGTVVYDKSFGYFTYDSLIAVQWGHLYDIASVTKTTAAVPAIMNQVAIGHMDLDNDLGTYLSDYQNSNKAELSISNLLMHQSGLKSYIPFWRHASMQKDSNVFLYKERKRRRSFSYLNVDWNDSIQSWIQGSKMNSLMNSDSSYRYLYSDLGFMLMKEVVENDCACTFDTHTDSLLYAPMGMDFTLFNPLEDFAKDQIAPTEQDNSFRKTLLQGNVHDKNAALLGGVSGHAGLFSNANDLAKYMQMMLQGGEYGGVKYFDEELIDQFTTKGENSYRRALGWDKPNRTVGNTSKYASDSAFGHSGFTGTLVWADPEYDLVYIFLSNRIYPDPQNYKLIESNTRTKIHDLMYESFLTQDQIKSESIAHGTSQL